MFAGFTPPQTPLLVIDRAALERNLRTMQALCDQAGVRLRAHGKTHKCSTLGRLQVELGAVGLCAQTVGEAEAFVAGGVSDVLVTAPIAPWGAPRLAALARTATIGCVADREDQIERLGAAAQGAGVTLGLVVDIDLGTHRTGCTPGKAETLARLAASTPGLRFAGLQGYLGHLQHMADVEQRKTANAAGAAEMKALVDRLTAAGLAPGVVTGGGTGTHLWDLASGVFTELQAGSYAVMDVEYAQCGAPGGDWAFEPALFVASTIISAEHATHATCDAGFKALSVDGPPAAVVGGGRWRPMGDEHGAVVPPPAGDIVWLQPGHCDPTINLYDAIYVVGETVERWPIDARRVSP